MITAYRAAGYHHPLRTEASRDDGRFHRAAAVGSHEPPTQYLSLHPLGPIAEWLRWNKPPREALQVLATATWALLVPDIGFLQITFENAHEYGISASELVADDSTACQALADELREGRCPGVIVPSAALPGANNLVVFDVRVPVGYLIEPIDPELDVPVGLTAHPSGASDRIYDLVRYRGSVHAAAEAFEAGHEFVLDERATWPH